MPKPDRNPMNRLIDGTQWRETPTGLLLVRGKRELYITARSVEQVRQARRLITTHSFDRLFKASHAVARNTGHLSLTQPKP